MKTIEELQSYLGTVSTLPVIVVCMGKIVVL